MTDEEFWRLDNEAAVEHVLQSYPAGSVCKKLSPSGYVVADTRGYSLGVSGTLRRPGWVPPPVYYVQRFLDEAGEEKFQFVDETEYKRLHEDESVDTDDLSTIFANNYHASSAEESWEGQKSEDWWYSTN